MKKLPFYFFLFLCLNIFAHPNTLTEKYSHEMAYLPTPLPDRVVLTWNDVAESSKDQFLPDSLQYDFEGYANSAILQGTMPKPLSANLGRHAADPQSKTGREVSEISDLQTQSILAK